MTTTPGPEPAPASRTVSRGLLARELLDILDETFDEHHGIFLDRGTGLFETLRGISAAEASVPPFPGGATIAAKVAHVIVYLGMLERYLRTGAAERVDWGDEATVSSGLAMVVHAAYHLGEVREAMGVVRAARGSE